MSAKKKNKDEHKDKFDENINPGGMGTVDNKGVSEETGMNRNRKNDKSKKGEGIEEFNEDDANFLEGDNENNNDD